MGSLSPESESIKGMNRNCVLLIVISVRLLIYYKSVLTNSVGGLIVSQSARVKGKAVNAFANMF